MKNKGVISKKWFLYITEFFSGMSVMAVELGASRLLAPYFSSSQIVWTIIIGAIMIAMALGNVWGGRASDKNPDPSRLYLRVLVAGVWIAAIPLVGKYIISGVAVVTALIITKNYLVWASLISCLIIFVFPLMLLGTVTPSLIKSAVKDLENSGRTAGELGALNTIGSIIGTFLPTFVTIPAFGTAVTFLIFAVILIAIAAIYLISARVSLVKCAVCIVLALGLGIPGCFGGFAFWENDLLYEGESIYNYIQIKETPDEIILSTNVMFGVQSVKTKTPGLTGYYYDTALAGAFMADDEGDDGLDVLILGLCSGTYATQCFHYFDGVKVDGVEIDGKIADLATEYFSLPEETKVYVDDGRSFLHAGQGKNKKYDLIMIDAYQDITIPFYMTSVEFFGVIKEHLTAGGVVVINLNVFSDAEGAVNQYISDTARSVFPYVYSVNAGSNRELFATFDEGCMKRFRDSYSECENYDLYMKMKNVDTKLTECDEGTRILTDDNAPVELLGMRAIDGMIMSELSYIRTIFKEQGIKGLIDFIR